MLFRSLSRSVLNLRVQNKASILNRSLYVNMVLRENFNVQDSKDFDNRVLKSQVPVVVDFHAKWCGPCKILGPRLDIIEEQKKGKIHLAKVDIDENDDLAAEYQVSAVPFVIAVKNGQVVDKFVGLLEDDKLTAFVDKLIGPSS